ncbi:MAG: nitroreductase family protein [Synergistaceae bacterium]|nr:nitroreductase family protein [Synergistaceae bacterium]
MKKLIVTALIFFLLYSVSFAEDAIKPPDPVKTGGMPVLEAISNRQSAGDFADVELTPEQLSTLLWAAGGVNRENGKLTYPTASNVQDIIIFAFTKSGVYRYNPAEHSITKVADGDHRALTGTPRQAFVARAAVDLLFIQDTGKWPEGRPADVVLNCGFAHAGLSMQNVYLFAAFQGWGARTRMNFDREKLKELLGLTDKHNFTLMQCVGPKP